MAIDLEKYTELNKLCSDRGITLVAVSKTKPVEDILALYQAGQRDFGENYVQELVDKQALLPADIRWHFIGHLQSNKVKYIAPFVHLVHGVDSLRLLQEINKQAIKNNRVINCLLQVHIAREETKFGMDESELDQAIRSVLEHPENFSGVSICGLMGMASFSEDMNLVRSEFRYLKSLFDRHTQPQTSNISFHILSCGMSSDYHVALEEGSNLIRVGSLLFGTRS
ncbi:YggS family pyridoxal phosphate-dependent enzyme [Flavihumibacter stibioxidans]|uniref:Pyridoxal phosphate homeostasis protein n=1 Tax=Flavihumibacter stibioxidans TaxID=1834163 RepID=A0ABR7M4P1_9BACT|nr:YggS family pyridoxal phosphate-dependent enzyme [Flavihumibacter stibioxidans]MBC6489975.1 YggS family pyridoxal phosphate enzyme [Flavihumibacter stibioxidans]